MSKLTLLAISLSIVLISRNLTMIEIMRCINMGRRPIAIRQKGEFLNLISRPNEGRFISYFHGKTPYKIKYFKFADWRKSDTLIINGINIALIQKLDPTTIQVYSLRFNDRQYLCLLGNSESASGSGTQLTFYIFLQIKRERFDKPIFFESRFGIIDNIGDFDGDGQLDYFKVTNDPEVMNKYIGKVYSLQETTKDIDSKKYIRMIYVGNDHFIVEKYNWFKELNCLGRNKVLN